MTAWRIRWHFGASSSASVKFDRIRPIRGKVFTRPSMPVIRNDEKSDVNSDEKMTEVNGKICSSLRVGKFSNGALVRRCRFGFSGNG